MKKVIFQILFSANSTALIIPSTRMMSAPSSFMWAINNSCPLLDLSFFNMCRSHGDELCELLPCGAKRRILFLLSWSSYFLTWMNKKYHFLFFFFSRGTQETSLSKHMLFSWFIIQIYKCTFFSVWVTHFFSVKKQGLNLNHSALIYT